MYEMSFRIQCLCAVKVTANHQKNGANVASLVPAIEDVYFRTFDRVGRPRRRRVSLQCQPGKHVLAGLLNSPIPAAIRIMGWSHSSVNLHAACGCVRSCCQILKKLKEGCGLAEKQSAGGQEFHGPHGGSLRVRRSNDRTYRERPA